MSLLKVFSPYINGDTWYNRYSLQRSTIILLIGVLVVFDCAGNEICDARIAAGVFAIFNSVAYGFGAFILLNDYKSTPPELQ
jgi:hypothetical protein